MMRSSIAAHGNAMGLLEKEILSLKGSFISGIVSYGYEAAIQAAGR